MTTLLILYFLIKLRFTVSTQLPFISLLVKSDRVTSDSTAMADVETSNVHNVHCPCNYLRKCIFGLVAFFFIIYLDVVDRVEIDIQYPSFCF